jgi:hypothetical protein
MIHVKPSPRGEQGVALGDVCNNAPRVKVDRRSIVARLGRRVDREVLAVRTAWVGNGLLPVLALAELLILAQLVPAIVEVATGDCRPAPPNSWPTRSVRSSCCRSGCSGRRGEVDVEHAGLLTLVLVVVCFAVSGRAPASPDWTFEGSLSPIHGWSLWECGWICG